MAEVVTRHAMQEDGGNVVGESYRPHSSESAGNATEAHHAHYNPAYY